ncbi:hypothetical protein MRX96_059463 [Rhipicephalus microplus]
MALPLFRLGNLFAVANRSWLSLCSGLASDPPLLFARGSRTDPAEQLTRRCYPRSSPSDLARRRHRHRERAGKNRRRVRAATARPERLWDHAVIPYEIDSNFSVGEAVSSYVAKKVKIKKEARGCCRRVVGESCGTDGVYSPRREGKGLSEYSEGRVLSPSSLELSVVRHGELVEEKEHRCSLQLLPVVADTEQRAGRVSKEEGVYTRRCR